MTTNNSSAEKGKKPVKKLSRAANMIVLAGSLLGAFLLWIYAIGYDSTLSESTYNGIAVTVEGEEKLVSEKGFTLAKGQSFSSITVVAKGKRADLNALDASDFRAVVDVSGAESAGNQTMQVTVYSPNGIEVVSQSTSTVQVFVDEFTQYSELLTVDINSGEYRYGEGVTDVDFTVNPIAVTVSGPKSILDTVAGAFVDFDLQGTVINDNFRGYGAIQLRDKDGAVINNSYIVVSDSTAEIAATVTKEKAVPVKVVFTGGRFDLGEENYVKSHDSITVSGAPEKLAAINELVLTIDETALTPNKTNELKFPIAAMLPEGVSSSNSGSISVTVTMPVLSVRTIRVKAENITVSNLPEGYSYEISGDIKVKLIGQTEAVDAYDISLVTAEVDYNDITVNPDGTYSAAAKIDLGGDYPLIYVQNTEYIVEFTVDADTVPQNV